MDELDEAQPLSAAHGNSQSDFEVIQNNGQNYGNLSEELQQAKEELEIWQRKIDKIEKEKSDLLCEKLDADESKKQIANHLSKLNTEHERLQIKFQKTEQSFKEKLIDEQNKGSTLKRQLLELENELQNKRFHCDQLQTKFKIKAVLPEKNVKFTKSEESVPTDEEGIEFLNIKCCYTILPKVTLLLQNGQALITFEDEQVADKILKTSKYQVNLDPGKLDVKIYPVKLDIARLFEIHIDVSRKMVKVSQIPDDLPEEQMRDKLEISFSKPSLGGGEVEKINYDSINGTADVTFVEKGVAQRVAEQKKYHIIITENTSCWVAVEPVMDYSLEKFQTFNGICKRTVLLSDIKNIMEEEELQDKFEIYFQKPSNHGGEVESIKYVPKDQQLIVNFEEDTEEK
ncbi:N-myc-interactor [Heptranchias perlo]|uniref:N-myc-interactor n=1 Tax=Heptranchias perlo TaxID=212740 RepID=UPI003559EBA4